MYPEQTICFDFNSKLKSRHKKALNFMYAQHPPLDVASDTNNNIMVCYYNSFVFVITDKYNSLDVQNDEVFMIDSITVE